MSRPALVDAVAQPRPAPGGADVLAERERCRRVHRDPKRRRLGLPREARVGRPPRRAAQRAIPPAASRARATVARRRHGSVRRPRGIREARGYAPRQRSRYPRQEPMPIQPWTDRSITGLRPLSGRRKTLFGVAREWSYSSLSRGRVRRRLLRREEAGERRRAGELDAGVRRDAGADTEAAAAARDRLADVGLRHGSQPDLAVRAPSPVPHRVVVRRQAARRVPAGGRVRAAHLHEQSGRHVLGRCEDGQGGLASHGRAAAPRRAPRSTASSSSSRS